MKENKKVRKQENTLSTKKKRKKRERKHGLDQEIDLTFLLSFINSHLRPRMLMRVKIRRREVVRGLGCRDDPVSKNVKEERVCFP